MYWFFVQQLITVLVSWHILGHMTTCFSSFVSDIGNLVGGGLFYLAFCELTWNYIRRLHVFTEIKASFNAKQNDCGAYFSGIHPHEGAISQNSLLVGTVSYRDMQFCSGIPIAKYDTWQTWQGLSNTTHVRKLVIGRSFFMISEAMGSGEGYLSGKVMSLYSLFINKTLILCVLLSAKNVHLVCMRRTCRT
jgi:hypothetical protein